MTLMCVQEVDVMKGTEVAMRSSKGSLVLPIILIVREDEQRCPPIGGETPHLVVAQLLKARSTRTQLCKMQTNPPPIHMGGIMSCK